MTTRLSIGDFSRMTYLSVKALRHYHEVGVLEPAEVDPVSGYRYYRPGQVATAQMIRRLRDLDVPLDSVRRIVQAPDPAARDAFSLLHAAERSVGARRSGPDGALFPQEFFSEAVGDVTAFVPVSEVSPGLELPGRVGLAVVPALMAAVTVHDGPFGDLDRTYGRLGAWVLERAAGAPGPIREYYRPLGDPDDLLAHTTEVCWPIIDRRFGDVASG
jgi:DNA-binding transcriptional MerR regulator